MVFEYISVVLSIFENKISNFMSKFNLKKLLFFYFYGRSLWSKNFFECVLLTFFIYRKVSNQTSTSKSLRFSSVENLFGLKLSVPMSVFPSKYGFLTIFSGEYHINSSSDLEFFRKVEFFSKA